MTTKTLLLSLSLLSFLISKRAFSQKMEPAPVFPKNPPQGFYLKKVVLYFPAENKSIHGLKYGMGADPGPDTIQLRSFTYPRNNTNEDTTFYLLTVAPSEQYFFQFESGTSMMANAGSFVQMANCWRDNKMMKIRGEVFLQVQNDSVSVAIEGIKLNVTKGTVTNISSYVDEPFYTISLEKGMINIEHTRTAIQLKEPGTEIRFSKTSKEIFPKSCAVSQIRAWVNGGQRQIDFAYAMRQIRRWYNYPVVFPDGEITAATPAYFSYRTTNLNEVLKFYQQANPQLDFQLGNKAIVIRTKRTNPNNNSDDRLGKSTYRNFNQRLR